jgi:hypothetical protein
VLGRRDAVDSAFSGHDVQPTGRASVTMTGVGP